MHPKTIKSKNNGCGTAPGNLVLTKKGDINPQKNSETPPGVLGGVFIYFLKKIVENFKSCVRVPKLWI